MVNALARRTRWTIRTLGMVLAGLLGAGVAVVAIPVDTAAAASDGTVTITGHGWGHGRGMGQYGAYGYAKNLGWTYDAILAHYYGGTTLRSDAGNPTMSVELTRLTGRSAILTGPGLAVNGALVGRGVVMVARTGAGTLQVFAADSCAGPWDQPWGAPVASGLTVSTSSGLVVACEPSQGTGYRGVIQVKDVSGVQYAVNLVPTEDYLRGVVPREMPASWGSSGGAEALKVQAVAARSYALGSAPRAVSGALTCDTTSCQVYGGATQQVYPAPTPTSLESSLTDAAILATRGQVMRVTGGTTIARTEFSSSTGGWTAGGTFPAVEDLGDTISPYHTWTASTSLAAVATALATGPIRTIAVTARDGNGADGGRVKEVTVVPVVGTPLTFTGATIRSKLGLRSDWFSISAISVTAARAVVQALYQDVLGRAPDAAGLDYWTAVVTATGDPARVAASIVASQERLQNLVRAGYRLALHRDPEPGGLAYWTAYLGATQRVSDLQVSLFSSPESLQVLGGGDRQAWVAGMYAALLGRPAAPSETAYWAQLAQGAGPQFVVGWIARSDESGTRRLNGYYQTFLGRDVDSSGLSSWLPLMAGTGDFTIPGILGASPEYWALAQVRFP